MRETVLTEGELLAYCHDCKSGDKKKDVNVTISSVRVHALLDAFLLIILLAEDLAEHTPLELSSRMTCADIKCETWSKAQYGSTRKSIRELMVASDD